MSRSSSHGAINASNRALFPEYLDDVCYYPSIWEIATEYVDRNPLLSEHRHFIEKGQFGYGEKQFHYVWDKLFSVMPDDFKFLEIGVFQGQVLSLMSLLNKVSGKKGTIAGVTPLGKEGDQYQTHPDIDYKARIRELFLAFSLPSPDIYRGQSFDPRIQTLVRADGPWDIVYIDGCHDYPVVMDDLRTYSIMVKQGGYLVVDDAANNKRIPRKLVPQDWFGLADVSRAVDEYIDGHPSWLEVACVGHLRVFKRRA